MVIMFFSTTFANHHQYRIFLSCFPSPQRVKLNVLYINILALLRPFFYIKNLYSD